MIGDEGWAAHNIWEHSDAVRDLYARRARDEAEEMTCAAQAAELLRPLVLPGETLLDAGCGAGYFFHSLRKRDIPVEYFGIDATAAFIDIGRRELAAFGLPAERLKLMRIEDLSGEADHVVCLNVLTNLDNYHRPLERLLETSRKSLILRESLKNGAEYRYVTDEHLNPGTRLKVHVNAYDREEVKAFIRSYGFAVEEAADRRSGGEPEMVIGHPHYWTFLVATRR